MNIKKYYTYKTTHQIWRLLISTGDKIIIETRIPNNKEAFFHCFDINKGKMIFSDFQLEEKYYVGIETVYKEIIYFHKFPKPDLPLHKEIIAFDINTQKVLWTNNELSFLFALDKKIYGFKQGFEERYFSSLDYLTGDLIEDLGTDYVKINHLRAKSELEMDYSAYLFPQTYYDANNKISNGPKAHLPLTAMIKDYLSNLEIVGNVEYNIYKNLLLLSFHTKILSENFRNNFAAVDIETGSIVISEVLNSNTKLLMTDSFFMYKNFLILLKEKNGLIIYKLE